MRHHWLFDKEKLSGAFYESMKSRFELVHREYFPNVFREIMYDTVDEQLIEMFESEVMSVLNGNEEVFENYHQYERNFEPVFMSKSKRDQFLKEVYGWKVYMGRNFLLSLDKKEVKFYKEVIKYWSEKGYFEKKEKLGRIILIISAKGIDYVEKELLK